MPSKLLAMATVVLLLAAGIPSLRAQDAPSMRSTSETTLMQKVPRRHRSLLQDTVASVGSSIVPIGGESPPEVAAAAAAVAPPTSASHAPDTPDASVGEPIPGVEASADEPEVATAAASATPRPGKRAAIIQAVPGKAFGIAAVTPAQTTQITIYEHANFAGRAGVAGPGDYRSIPAEFNDMITSIRVPAGLKVTLWEHGSYTGRGLIITGPADIPDISPWNFNDITSSFKVESSSSSPPVTNNYATELLNLVNNARTQAGLGRVTLDARLNTAALAHAQDMANRQQMSHTGSDGADFATRISRTGYRWGAAAENVAVGQATAASVFNAWMNSPGHRANIMNGAYIHMGIAMASSNAPYWCQLFARPQ